MSHGHHDDSHGSAAAAVAGEPTAYLSDPSKASTLRCKRRWNDFELLKLDALGPGTLNGPDARVKDQKQFYQALRERYLLFVACVESKPGAEPKHPYLYPMPAVGGAAGGAGAVHHH